MKGCFCLCCRARCSALGLLAAPKAPAAEIPLIGCSFSGKQEGKRVCSAVLTAEVVTNCAPSAAVAALGIRSARRLNGTRR